MNPVIRYANIDDIDKIIYFIKELAVYEKMQDEVVTNKDLVKKWIFDLKIAEVLFVMEQNKEVGFALFFHNYSTFVGKAGKLMNNAFDIVGINREKVYIANIKTELFNEFQVNAEKLISCLQIEGGM